VQAVQVQLVLFIQDLSPMSLKDRLNLSLQARFSLAIGLSVAAFMLIALILLASFVQVRSSIRDVVGMQLRQTTENAFLSREIGQFISRLKLLEVTFYGNDELLQQEGAVLHKMLDHKQHEHHHDQFSASLIRETEPLKEQLEEYLQQAAKINNLLALLETEEKGLHETFVILDELLAEQLSSREAAVDSPERYRQLMVQLASDRIALLEIFKLNRSEQLQQFFSASFFDVPPQAAEVGQLIEKFQQLTAQEPPFDRIGRHLVDQLKYYQHLLSRYQQEMIHLGRHAEQLSQMTDHLLWRLEELELNNRQLAAQTQQNLDTRIISTAVVVLALLTVLTLLLGVIQLNLFSAHVRKPMLKVRKRLLSFQRGDYSSPMVLERQDEWGEIENVFNNMLSDLVESWSAVQESERRYRNIFDSASIGIFQSLIDGTLIKINPTLSIMFGVDAYEDLSQLDDLGQRVYVNPQDRERLIERLLQEEVVSNYEVQMRRRSGKVFWASLNCHVVLDKDDEVTMIEGTVEDISQRREAEDELRRLKEYLHSIIDTMPSILVGVDDQLNVSLWNEQVAELTGISADQARERSLLEVFSLLHEGDYLAAVKQTLATREVLRLPQVTGINAGAGRFFDLLIYPLGTPEMAGAVIHMEDVTEKVQIEEVMVQSEKMLSVGSLAAGMAHEINNPLASVLQNVQVMEQRLSPALKKNQQVAEQLGISIEQVASYAEQRGFNQMIKSIAEAGQRAARIIENMLNFSRKSSSSFLPCSLADLTEKTIELAASDYDMKHHFDFRKITVVREYQPLPDIPCESSQIQQVILNLLKNAAQALGDTEEKEIRVRIFPRQNQACLQIEDNGEGMAEETRRRIFEPFYTTKEVGQGTGLGLSVSYFLITENHKGSLTVSSQPGKGTCFTILLPFER
jgi:PAS domain S-box-containing protein